MEEKSAFCVRGKSTEFRHMAEAQCILVDIIGFNFNGPAQDKFMDSPSSKRQKEIKSHHMWEIIGVRYDN